MPERASKSEKFRTPTVFGRARALPCGRSFESKSREMRDCKDLLSQAAAKLEKHTTARGLYLSEARTKILEVIVMQASHFRAQDLLGKLQERYPEVGRATLYRNLPVLVESGILQEGPRDPDGQVLYELTDDDHHDHLVCLDCHHIFEFHDDAIEKKQARVSKSLGFTVRDHRHVVYASCDRLVRRARRG